MIKFLHFADAHIDMIGQGRRDPQNGLPVRVNDFLKALDTIIDTAISERVDLVLFAGDAYRDRSPIPTYQREWGRRIMKLSRAGITTLLLIGNHDLSPAIGRANTMQEFDTLDVPHVRVLGQPCFLGPSELEGLPLQVIALPWVTRSGLVANLEISTSEITDVHEEMELRLKRIIDGWLEGSDPNLPLIFMAHATVQGAVYGNERSIMLGSDLILPGAMVCDPRIDYCALGHIHKKQDVNAGNHPPVIYPGSIERVDFGEAQDEKYFVVTMLEKHQPAQLQWHKLEGRKFIDRTVTIKDPAFFTQQAISTLPPEAELVDAIVRLTLDYPREWDAMLDETVLRKHAEKAFEFHLVRRPQTESRIRLPDDRTINSLTPMELLEIYWKIAKIKQPETTELMKFADEIIAEQDHA
jgi:DNA repair protein SbcD/Mre11